MKNGMPRRHTAVSMLVVVALVACVVVALPATAYAAKAVTRIVAVKTMTVDNDTKGMNPWPVNLAVKLQKRITTTHYHALSGTVKLYRYDPNLPGYRLVKTKIGSSLTFSLPGRGKYKLYYAGSATARSATAYTGVYETIGASLSTPTFEFAAVDGTTTQSWVTVKYDVTWNTEAVGDVWVGCEAWFTDNPETTYSTWLYYEREYQNPGLVEYTYKAENASTLDLLNTVGHIYVAWWDRGEYVKTPAAVRYSEATP